VDESEFIGHAPCEVCGSSDAKAVYSDGHAYCFSCQQHFKGESMNNVITLEHNDTTHNDFVHGSAQPLKSRKITSETCAKWGYETATYKGKPVQIANYRNQTGEVVAQKLRFPNKEFKFIGDTKNAGLYGMHLWRDGGKMVTITEGEIDALSLSQVQGLKWAVVSVPNGAAGAAKAVKRNLEWLLKFESVVFMFDNDDVGIKAAKECAALLPPKRAKIATLPMKDANEMLVAGRGGDLIQAMWDAKESRPDGIVAATDLWDTLVNRQEIKAYDYPFSGLNDKLIGVRKGELVTFTAGSGVGKSAFCREISYNLMEQGCTVGYIALEENNDRTMLGFMGIHEDLPLHLDRSIDVNNYREAYDHIAPKLFLYDNFGSTDINELYDKIRYLVRGVDCDVIVLDHLSMVVSGVSSSQESDERRMIDNLMTGLRSLVEELQCAMILVSHLRRPQGDRGYEQGQETSLNALRGSAAIAQLSDAVIGLERNQQGDNPHVTTVRVLKNRYTGETGVAGLIEYQRETGRLRELATGDTQLSAYDFTDGEAYGEF
jgi:twinkle protein